MNTIAAVNTYLAGGLPQVAKTLSQAAGAPKIVGADVLDLSTLNAGQPVRPAASAGGSFADVLGRMVTEVSAKQQAAGASVSALLSGGNVPLHQTVVAMEEASLSFQLMLEVRNKLLESYQELMRMQV